MQMQVARFARGAVLNPLLIAGAVISVTASPISWGDELAAHTEDAQSLQVAISKISPGATIPRADQVDDRECYLTSSPGLVRADFNGDGREDVAALLITRIADKGKVWDGREFRKADFLLALFINDGKGGYRVREVDRITNRVPAAIVLSVAPAGKVRSLEKGNESVLQNPGLVIQFCGKSSTAYTLVGDKLKEIALSD